MLDVVLFCEGTYPFIAGGVSSWIHTLISAMPELKFGIVFLSPGRSFKKELKYPLPPNLVEFVEVYIYDVRLVRQNPQRNSEQEEAAWAALENFSAGIIDGRWREIADLFQALGYPPRLSLEEMAFSDRAWDILLRQYHRCAPHLSFVDFFWTWRFIHFPLFQLLNAPIPQARVYHTVTTGWSGLLAALAKIRSGRPLLLTEHGIYTNERRIEIVKADWIYVEALQADGGQAFGFLKSLWIHLFQALGHLCYDMSDQIYTLYGGNKVKQVAAGADPDKIEIIPNGVRIDLFDRPDVSAENPQEFTIGFVGRVVPIKDVLTLIRACKIVGEAVPQARTYIIGPTDEDEEYFKQCRDLVETLGLRDKVIFTGPQDVKQWYPKLDALVLTSISEGQPLVILEAFVGGVPCVATDVGACSEILLGGEESDRQLGPAGFVTQVGSPYETAAALIQLARDPVLAERQRQAGRQRVRRYYDHCDMIRRYSDIYKKWMQYGRDRI
ncbi:MAG: GT4 family glycosyltransferase PelF [Candidatus Eremiobacteraeota bacterium]|nr:GT4 family glycosyltransferase PelF [Candidatus Eremiobacteraeota bacterium]MCW5872619.1 GT4 family glycosyltransferase PelF [Candidatus Eremiobacteraeota bacterium]